MAHYMIHLNTSNSKMKKGIIISIVLLLLLSVVAIYFYLNRDTSVFNKNATLSSIEFKDKVNIYVFWAEGCSHCEELYEYLEPLQKEYKNTFNIYGFEVSKNKINQDIMDSFKEELGGKKWEYSVPYFIIGDESMEGFSVGDKDEIIETILIKYENLNDINKFENIIK